MQSLKGESVAAIDVTPDDLAKYGLDKPYQKVSVRGKGGQSINVLTSEADNDGIIYTMTEGSSMICTIKKSENSWHGITRFDLLQDSVISVLPAEVQQLSTVIGSDKNTCIIEREQFMAGDNENETITVKCGDKIIPYTNITIFLNDLTQLSRTLELPDDISGFKDKLLEIDLKYYNYPELNDNIKLMRNSAGKTLIILNGTAECCVNSEKADKIIEQAKSIYTSPKMSSAF